MIHLLSATVRTLVTAATLAMVHELLPEGGLFISKSPCIGGKWYFRPLIRAMQLVGK